MSITTKAILPFTIQADSEVSGGYADKLHSEFFPRTEIADYHLDQYRIDEEEYIYRSTNIQSPFTELWVGGRSHRHVPLNDGQDDSSTRPEAWHIEYQPNSIRLYSHAQKNSPPAYWTREDFAKRPLNIRNIQNTERYVGNYNKNYEFLQTSGRRITNNLIVDGFEATSGLTTKFINGLEEYTLPDLNSTIGSKSVIVERFNAPGSKEESSRGSLDREGEEMSSNISLPWRNYKIRKPFYSQLSQSAAQFGPSIHGVNRNTLIRAGNIQRDNGFVVHAIPRTDIQYSWITASAITTAEQLGGYQSYNNPYGAGSLYNRSEAYSDIIFISGSHVLSDGAEVFVDNLFINSIVKEYKIIDTDTNTFFIHANILSSSLSEYVGSPYTFTSWVSMRLGELPVARALRNNNTMSVLNDAKPVTFQTLGGQLLTVHPRRGDTTTNYIDPAVTFKYKSVSHFVTLEEDSEEQLEIKHDYANSLSTFANKELIAKLKLLENTEAYYDLLREQYKDSVNSGLFYAGHTYKEGIWPAEENTGLKHTRIREKYLLEETGFLLAGGIVNRDSRDIQYGTQRAFWQDEKQKRKRSNSEDNRLPLIDEDGLPILTESPVYGEDSLPILVEKGGYYNSFNYASSFEQGFDFEVTGTTILQDETPLYYSYLFQANTGSMDDGLFNSISLMESQDDEILIYSSLGYVSNEKSDPFFEYVSLLLHMDYTTPIYFIDSSKNEHTVYREGDYLPGIFNGSQEGNFGDDESEETGNLRIVSDESLQFGTSDFVVEFWVKETSGYTEEAVLYKNYDSVVDSESLSVTLIYSPSPSIWTTYLNIGTNSAVIQAEIINDQWHNIVVQRSQGTIKMYLNGVSQGSYIYTSSLNGDGNTYIGNGLYGKMDEFRITKGRARYTSDFAIERTTLPEETLYYNLAHKRGYKLDVGGELNNAFVDSYGLSTTVGGLEVKSLGSIYRNSFYKALLTTKQYEFNSFDDQADITQIIKTEDDEVRLNPKLRYISFVGGGELNVSDWTKQNITKNSISSQMFDQTFELEDIAFSTLDNGLRRSTETDSGKKPFFDSYEEFIGNLYPLTKEMSVIPEFRISENLQYYVDEKDSDFSTVNRSFLSIDGIGSNYRSASTPTGSFDFNFLKTYATADILKKHDKIYEDNEELTELDSINITISGIKKLLPYNGFYPQDRITQIANLYGDYVDQNLAGGIYNVSFQSTNFEKQLFAHVEDSADLPPPNDMAVYSCPINLQTTIKYTNIATAYHDYSGNSGIVKLFKTVQDLSTEGISFQRLATYAGGNETQFGASIHMYGKPDGDQHKTYSYMSQINPGAVYLVTSSTPPGSGFPYSLPDPIATESQADEKFGFKIDGFYDENANKHILFIGAPEYDSPEVNRGQIYQITSSDNGETWSSPQGIINQVLGTNARCGTSISSVLYNNTYYLFFSYSPGYTYNNIGVVTSSDNGNSWSYLGVNSIFNHNNVSNINFCYGGIKAVEYNNKIYIFYGASREDSNKGKMYVALFHPVTGFETKIELTTGESLDYLPSEQPEYQAVDAFVTNGALYYTFSAKASDGSSGKVYYGLYSGGDFQTQEKLVQKTGATDNQNLGSAITMVATQEENIPLSVYSDENNIYILTAGNFTSVNLVVESTEAQRAFKHAAIEPLMAPGILYNTIKSGISVDWPCATGSLSLFSDNNILTSKYETKNFLINTYRSENELYSLQGSLKSAIDFRIPFENTLYPGEIFPEKQELTSDVKEVYTSAELIGTGSFISQFLEGCYIYGGYEPFVSDMDIGRINEKGSKRFSVPFVYRKENISDNGLYTMAVSNFLAETVKFFLQEEKMVTFTSKPDSDWDNFISGANYYMDVVLEKSQDLVMMEAYHSSKHPVGKNKEKMNGRYFGYPVNKTTKNILSGETFSAAEAKVMFNDPAYAPYTPPYFEGRAIARLSFVPDETRKYNVSEVFSKLQIEDIFAIAAKGWEEGSDAQINKMPVGSSIDLFGTIPAVSTTINTTRQGTTIDSRSTSQQLGNKVWVISPKLETPVLDFSDQELVPFEKNYLKSSGFGRGMWSGYGKIPTGKKGVSLSLTYPFAGKKRSPYRFGTNYKNEKSLLEHVGFAAEQQKIGKIASSKIISEAIIMIPYVDVEIKRNSSDPYSLQTIYNAFLEKNLIKINSEIYEIQKNNVLSEKSAISVGELGSDEEIINTSITNTIKKMQNYVLPPQLDFFNNTSIEPFTMYMFEFKHKLSQQDLVDIWQGLMPEISINAKFLGSGQELDDDVYYSHKSSIYEFFHAQPLPANLRWMIFKVKKRGEISYEKVTKSTKDDDRFERQLNIGRRKSIYGYNWPYDYFSLVEMAKIELELEYKKK